MDEQHFDREIKKQLESWEGPDFDPTALADLRYRLASVTKQPWYVRYRTGLLVATALLLFTIFTMTWQSRVDESRNQVLINVMDSLKHSQQTVAALQEQLSSQRAMIADSNSKEEQPPASLEVTPLHKINDFTDILKKANQRDPEALAFLRQVAHVLTAENSINQDDPSRNPNLPLLSASPYHFPGAVLSDSTTTVKQVVAQTDGGTRKAKEKRLSAATVRDLKKHFQRGIGIRLGPVAHLSGVGYQPGSMAASAGGGLLADWILSPSLSLETGALYTVRNYSREEDEALDWRNLPGVDESLGQLKEADIAAQLVQFPLNLKFYVPLSNQTEGILSGGYSWLLYLRQDLEFSYNFNDATTEDRSLSLKSTYEQSTPRLYPGTLNAAVGTSTLMKNAARLEFSLYYQYGLGPTGIEQVKASSLGLRTAYWFTVR